MKNKMIYILAFFLMASGSFFGYYMQMQVTEEKSNPAPIVGIAAREQRATEAQSTPVALPSEAALSAYMVQAVGDEIVIYNHTDREAVFRVPFDMERLFEKDKELLAEGILVETKEEALMIAEAFVN